MGDARHFPVRQVLKGVTGGGVGRAGFVGVANDEDEFFAHLSPGVHLAIQGGKVVDAGFGFDGGPVQIDVHAVDVGIGQGLRAVAAVGRAIGEIDIGRIRGGGRLGSGFPPQRRDMVCAWLNEHIRDNGRSD